ncbi:MAG: 23S rRNA (guanosine(2251)-2'-O)-methyltransferase RlmB [Pontibacterium sp.]
MQNDTIFGFHAINSALKLRGDRAIKLLVQKGRHDERLAETLAKADALGLTVQYKAKQALDDLSDGANHQGVVLVVKGLQTTPESALKGIVEAAGSQALFLVLDGVTDPHNLGACIRTADAAGVHAVIAPKDKSAPLNATVAKVACGAAEVVPYIQVTNLSRTLKQLQDLGVWITGTAGETELDVFDANLSGPTALVMGAEGKGMRRLTREHCDQLVRIPMAGEVSSLNVSVATGVCLFEVVRQRANA